MSPVNKRKAIEGARRIEWRGLSGVYSADLWTFVLREISRLRRNGGSSMLPFGGELVEATISDLEDLEVSLSRSYSLEQRIRIKGVGHG